MTEKAIIDALKSSFEMSKSLIKRAYEVDYQIAEHLMTQQQTINQLATLLHEFQQSEREFRINITERVYIVEKKIS